MYFKCVDDCLQYAADAETPFTQKQILQTVYYAISATSIYTKACKTWRKRNENTKSWALFKTFFASKYHDLNEQQQVNAKYSGYHSANMVREVDQRKHTDALDQLAFATGNDRTIIEKLNAANAELTATNTTLVAQLAKTTKVLKQLAEADQNRETMRKER